MSEFNGVVTQPINVMLDINLTCIQENRENLLPIVDAIKLRGNLGLPLMGHIDDTKYHAELGSYSSSKVGNPLNFRE